MTDSEKKVFEIQTLGATPDDVARLKIMIETLERLREEADKTKKAADALKDMQDEGARLTESLRTELEKFNDEVARFDKLLENKAIGQETYARAIARAKKELDGLAKVEKEMGRASEASQVERLAIAAMAKRSRDAAAGGLKNNLGFQNMMNIIADVGLKKNPHFFFGEQQTIDVNPAARTIDANPMIPKPGESSSQINRPSPGSKSVADATKKVIEVKGMDRVISLLGDIATNTGNFTVLS